MATTGPKLTIPFIVGTGQIVGQGNSPELWMLYSTDDATSTSPVWVDATANVRGFTTSRGRDSELGDVNAGTATIILDNRTRTFDPVNNALIKPLNQWWIREQFTGETQDVFKGYAESYEQGWAGQPNDATTTVSCADEFKVLALANLPTTSPPRNSYAELVTGDNPTGYWPLEVISPNLSFASSLPGNPGLNLVQVGSIGGDLGAGAIIGEELGADLNETAGNYLTTQGLVPGDSGDVSGRSAFTIEGWFKTDTPNLLQNWVVGPNTTGAFNTYYLQQQVSRVLNFVCRNSSGTTQTVSTGVLSASIYYHIVGTFGSGTMTLYVNGVSVGTGSLSSAFAATLDTNAALLVGPTVASASEQYWIDEVAFYPYALSSTQVANHYQAGVARGFPFAQGPGARAGAVLDAIGSHAPRNLRAGTRFLTGSYMTGQSPLDELRKCRQAESVDAILYTARDGTVTLLDAAYRSVSPWDTVQATFGDAGGAELPYQDLTVDYSDGFLTNEWNVARTNGLVQTASDATSITKYYKRSQSLTDLPVTQDSQCATIATALLAKYKDPFTRVTSITLSTATAAVSEAIFRRDIGDRIRVLRTPPGGGSRIDQTVFIQKIDMNATPSGPWTVTWTVSPL